MLKENLIMLRNLNGYSQEEIAGRIGISRQAYAKWERGTTVPDIVKCGALAQVYGVSIDSLLKTEKADGIGMIPPAQNGKHIWGSVRVGDRGQIVIPKKAREIFDLKAGDGLVILGDEEQGLAMIKSSAMMNLMHGIKDYFNKEK